MIHVSRLAAALVVVATASGCYRAHERELVDDGGQPDVGVDAYAPDVWVAVDAGIDAPDVGPDTWVRPDSGVVPVCTPRIGCVPTDAIIVNLTEAVPATGSDGCVHVIMGPAGTLRCEDGLHLRAIRCGEVGRYISVLATVISVQDAGTVDFRGVTTLDYDRCACIPISGNHAANPLVGDVVSPGSGPEDHGTRDYVFVGRNVVYDVEVCAIR